MWVPVHGAPSRARARLAQVNNHTGGCSWLRPTDPRHAGILAAAITGAALLMAACGGSPTSTDPGSRAFHRAYKKELAYAECMRSHDLPSFPDPDGNGIFETTITNRNDFDGPAYTSANKSCAHLAGHPPAAAQLQLSEIQALKYAACMRSHGITTFRAATTGDQIRMGFDGSSSARNSTRFLIAQRICQPLLPKLLGES